MSSGPSASGPPAVEVPASGWTRLGMLLLILPGFGHLLMLCIAMFGRLGFPYDLEWMEGGMLTHAQRIADGAGIYVEPSVDFIPFLYTPLYPGIIGMLSPLFGISYWVGRALSIASTLGICVLLVLMVRRESNRATRKLALVGGIAAIGFFAATYPWVEGWYDLVRADSLFLFMVLGGLWGVRNWARAPGLEGMAKLACAASLLGLSFFAKQTGVLFVATGGFMVLALNWRRVPIYVAVTGVLGLGGTWLLNKMSAKWFWVYIYETHQHHDFNMDRFYKSFENMLWHFPLMSAVIAIGIVLMLATVITKRTLPPAARGLALWTPVFAVAVVVGAIGWGTEFAHFNAYIPAMLFGALCAGLAIPSIAGCLALWIPEPSVEVSRLPTRAGMLAGAGLALQLGLSYWSPAPFIPSEAEYQAGHQLVHTLREVEGDVFIPYHPWYASLAGKDTKVHLMGLRDMTTGKVWKIRGLDEALENHRFGAIVFDNRPVGQELRGMHRNYRMDDYLPATSSPHVFTGAGAVWNKAVATLIPRSIWVPNQPLQVPPGTRVLWDFEDGLMAGWKSEGTSGAWGRRAVSRPLAQQGPVRRYGGRYYLTSFHGGDEATGTLRSPTFLLDGSSLSFRLSGGKSENLRVELHVDGQIVKTATGQQSERMEDVTWNVAAEEGKNATIVLVDEDSGPWGHLNVDEFWIH